MRISKFISLGERKELRGNSGRRLRTEPPPVRPLLGAPAGLPPTIAEYGWPEAAKKAGAKLNPSNSFRANLRFDPKGFGDQTTLAVNLSGMSKLDVR